MHLRAISFLGYVPPAKEFNQPPAHWHPKPRMFNGGKRCCLIPGGGLTTRIDPGTSSDRKDHNAKQNASYCRRVPN